MATTKRPVRRNDPTARPIDGLAGKFTLQDKNPEYDYKWVPEHGDFDVAYFESFDWEKCVYREGSARPMRSSLKKEGAVITQGGQILLCRPKSIGVEEYKAQQAELDETEKAIFDQSFGRRLLSRYGAGPSGPFDAVNESGMGSYLR